MSEAQAKQAIVVASVVAILLRYVDYRIRGRKDTLADLTQAVLAVGFASFTLSIIAEFAPRIAGPMAALLLTVAVVGTDPDVLRRLVPERRAPSTVDTSDAAERTKEQSIIPFN